MKNYDPDYIYKMPPVHDSGSFIPDPLIIGDLVFYEHKSNLPIETIWTNGLRRNQFLNPNSRI